MSQASERRGEIEISIEGIAHVLRPSHEAIDEFESKTGKALGELYDASARDALKLRELAVIVGACVRAAGRQTNNHTIAAYKDDRIREILPSEDGGILIATTKVKLMLWLALTGGVDSKGEVKAPATMTTTSEQTKSEPELESQPA